MLFSSFGPSQACSFKEIDSQAYLGQPTSSSNSLSAVFLPKSVAVIGATDREGAVGKTILENLVSSRQSIVGATFCVYPINPTRPVVCGLPAFSDVSLCPTQVELAVVVTPAKTVKSILESCGKAKVSAAIVISAGFKEMGPEGLQLENEVVAVAHHYNIRLIGPNCLGVMSPHFGMNATFAASNAIPGTIAFISQSGAMCTAVLDWSITEGLGFSAFVSIGSMADVNWGDLIDYLGRDLNTHSILIYMETIGNAAHFLSAATTVSRRKPIIVIKAGQTEAAAQAAVSHTGSLSGSHDAFLAAMKRAGVMVVDTIGELFDCALMLGKQPRPRGENLVIITNAGGPGVLATDATSLSGASVCKLEAATIQALNAFLPAAWSHSNPIDILGDASADVYGRTMEVALVDKNVDGALIILAPQSVTDPTGAAKKVTEVYGRMRHSGVLTKPVMCAWMGGDQSSDGRHLLSKSNIPVFTLPDAAASIYGKIWSHSKNLQLMHQAPGVEVGDTSEYPIQQDIAVQTIRAVCAQNRYLLTEAESKLVLKSFGIPVVETVVCSTVEDAMRSGDAIGYPCVVKLHSESMTHKSDVGGVKLNIKSADEIRAAWDDIKTSADKFGSQHFQGVSVQPMLRVENGIELIFGSNIDNQFGPLVLFGAGGCMVEIMKDRALGLPPLNPTLAQIQMESTNIYKALKGGHGKRFRGVDLSALNKAFCRFSQMICDLSEFVVECDINPVLALPDRLVALDARFVLRQPTQPVTKLVIRPYPTEYVFQHALKNDQRLLIRPVHANDTTRLVEFYQSLSSPTVFQKNTAENSVILPSGAGMLPHDSVTLERIVSLATDDYARFITLAAIHESSHSILGMVRLTRSPDHRQAELTMLIGDSGQLQGVGGILLEDAIKVARSENLQSLLVHFLNTSASNVQGKCTNMSIGKAAEV